MLSNPIPAIISNCYTSEARRPPNIIDRVAAEIFFEAVIGKKIDEVVSIDLPEPIIQVRIVPHHTRFACCTRTDVATVIVLVQIWTSTILGIGVAHIGW